MNSLPPGAEVEGDFASSANALRAQGRVEAAAFPADDEATLLAKSGEEMRS